MPHVKKLIRKEINFKHPMQNTATFCKLEKLESKTINILEKNLRSTVKPTQCIAQLTEADGQTETPKTVVVKDQQTQSALTQMETSACPSLSSPGNISPIPWDADDSSVNLIEVTVDEFPTDDSLILDPITGFFVPETPDADVKSTPWCSTPIHQSDLLPIPLIPPTIDFVPPTITNQEIKVPSSVPDEGANVTISNSAIVLFLIHPVKLKLFQLQ